MYYHILYTNYQIACIKSQDMLIEDFKNVFSKWSNKFVSCHVKLLNQVFRGIVDNKKNNENEMKG